MQVLQARASLDAQAPTRKRRIGILGYGRLGQFLVEALRERPELRQRFELAFVWNRSADKLKGCPAEVPRLEDPAQAAACRPDLVVEVAGPQVTKRYAAGMLAFSDYLVGSPTALADPHTESRLLRRFEEETGEDKPCGVDEPHAERGGLCVARGALAGLDDLRLAARSGRLESLRVTMRKAPESIHFDGAACEPDRAGVLYEGPVRQLCALAPHNVNTMAVAALASGLGLDRAVGCLVAVPGLSYHEVLVEAFGPRESVASGDAAGDDSAAPRFSLRIEKRNPAATGAVTGNATQASFLNSVVQAASASLGAGVHYC